jgi:hypothetical protein
VFIINVKVSDKLIVFSNTEVSTYETNFQRLYIQSADVYSYYKGSDKLREYKDRNDSSKTVKIAPRALLVTFTWDNFYFDVNCLKQYHLPNDTLPGTYDNVSFIDISKPYVSKLDIEKKILVMYVPQGSNFYLDFLQKDKTATSTVDVNIMVAIIDNTKTDYDIYDDVYAGYSYGANGYMNLINYIKE